MTAEGMALRSRLLLGGGLVAMVLGALDPLEGSLVVLAGAALAALAAHLGDSAHRWSINRGLALLAIGVAALFGLSAIGGIGGRTGRPVWWAIVLLPYPLGWVVTLVGAVRAWR